jgi:hypothetical protein
LKGADWRNEAALRLKRQAKACRSLGSPLYALLLTSMAEDVAAAGPSWTVVRRFEGEPEGSALPLRLMAAVHRLVLRGEAPGLASYYPSVGGEPGPGAWRALHDILATRRHELVNLIDRPLQTNEVGRSAPLLVGLAAITASGGPRVRLLELGASAGLNLNCDRYWIEALGRSFGPRSSSVHVAPDCSGALSKGPDPEIVERRGCDLHPVDVGSANEREALMAATWPDQADRLSRLRSAMSLWSAERPVVDRADAASWIEERLAEPTHADRTVVFHSIVWQYLTATDRGRITTALSEFARTTEHRLHHLSMDRGGELAMLRLEALGDEGPTPLARVGYHGDPILATSRLAA